MATVSLRRAIKRDPVLLGLLMFSIGIILMALGLVVNHKTHSGVGGLIVVVGLITLVMGCAFAASEKPWRQKRR